MADALACLVLAAVVVAAGAHVIRARRRGARCVGCDCGCGHGCGCDPRGGCRG